MLSLHGLELWSLSSPARSQSLYRLTYPGSEMCLQDVIRVSTSCWGHSLIIVIKLPPNRP
jgi:hypothetical protein